MTRTQAIAALVSLAFAGLAHAGNQGAGPAATGSPAVGSVVTPGSALMLQTPTKDSSGHDVLPGDGGMVTLSPQQVESMAKILLSFDGAAQEGDVIRAPTTMADETPAQIALNKKTGTLLLTRRK